MHASLASNIKSSVTCTCRLVIGVITYFVAGALIMKLHYKATGTDIIPNKKLWFSLPLLLKVQLAS